MSSGLIETIIRYDEQKVLSDLIRNTYPNLKSITVAQLVDGMIHKRDILNRGNIECPIGINVRNISDICEECEDFKTCVGAGL